MLPGDGGSGGLFLAQLPEPPGDPAALSAGAATYSAAHGELERNRAALASAASQASATAWSGAGATAFVTVAADLTAAYGLTAEALARGAAALRGYAAELAAAKAATRRANEAIAAANAAATALLAAQDAASQSQDAAEQAAQAADTAATHAAASPHSPAAATAADTARSAAADAQTAATGAMNRVSALSAQYDADRARALALTARAKQQATAAAAKAAAAFDAAAAGLAGKAPRPVRGGAHGVRGNPWDVVIEVVEDTHTALGAAGIDAMLWYMGLGAKQAEEFMKGLPAKEVEWLDKIYPWGQGASDDELAAAVHRWWMKSDAAEAFGEKFVADTKYLGMASRVLRVGGSPFAIAGDVSTMVNPPQSGTMGLVDRVVAGANGGLVVADGIGAVGELAGVAGLATLSLSGAFVPIAVGTGLYLAGAYAYKHWAWFRQDLAKPIGHAVADGAKDLYHGVADLGHEVWSLL